MKVTYDTARVRQVAEQAIRKAVQAKDNPADLINVALEELVRARCELPGYTTLDAMATAIRTEVNAAFYQAVASPIDMAARARLARLLLANLSTATKWGITRIDALRGLFSGHPWMPPGLEPATG